MTRFVHRFRNQGLPSMHVDIHGKKNRKKESIHHIDLGIAPLEACAIDPIVIHGMSYGSYAKCAYNIG